MSSIIIVKNSPIYNHVRVIKFIDYFKSRGFTIESMCWFRGSKREAKGKENFIFFGGGSGSRKLIFFYPAWICKLFFNLLFYKTEKDSVFFVIDFDSAISVYLASFFRKDIKYIYDIHDDFSKRYRLPVVINKFISYLDSKVRNRSFKVIHVDENRVSKSDQNYIIIYNSPKDIYNVYEPPLLNSIKTFAVTGLLNYTRGLNSLYEFASKNPSYNFIVAGNPADNYAKKFIKLNNINFIGSISQEKLFEKIKNCHAIFSLYDPSLEINRLAASNKLYDCLMLGIPVVSNYDLVVSSKIKEQDLGFLVNFNYDSTWNVLVDAPTNEYLSKGKNCRLLYEKDFDFEENFNKKLDNLIKL